MKKAYIYNDEKSNKFWWIDYNGSDFVVNYGKHRTSGKYEIKEFDSAEECEKQALKLIKQKTKKGYIEKLDFDFINHFYFDDQEIGPHLKTSHPNFVEYFNSEIYYDCCDEEAPFGSDEGSDSLYELEEHIRKHGNKNITSFPEIIIRKSWGMTYIPPNNLEEEHIKELIKERFTEDLVYQSDQVIIAVAFGQIKITGFIDKNLKSLVIYALKRLNIITKLQGLGSSEIVNKLIRDIEYFELFTSNES